MPKIRAVGRNLYIFQENLLRIIASQPTNSGIEHLSSGGGDGEGAWEVLDVVLVVVVVVVVVVGAVVLGKLEAREL